MISINLLITEDVFKSLSVITEIRVLLLYGIRIYVQFPQQDYVPEDIKYIRGYIW